MNETQRTVAQVAATLLGPGLRAVGDNNPKYVDIAFAVEVAWQIVGTAEKETPQEYTHG